MNIFCQIWSVGRAAVAEPLLWGGDRDDNHYGDNNEIIHFVDRKQHVYLLFCRSHQTGSLTDQEERFPRRDAEREKTW